MDQKVRHRLPNGKTTTSVRVYASAWRRFTNPLCKALGGELVAFDPGVVVAVLSPEGRAYERSVSLDTWVVTRLNESLARLDGLKK
jgi:hypothetical protein